MTARAGKQTGIRGEDCHRRFGGTEGFRVHQASDGRCRTVRELRRLRLHRRADGVWVRSHDARAQRQLRLFRPGKPVLPENTVRSRLLRETGEQSRPADGAINAGVPDVVWQLAFWGLVLGAAAMIMSEPRETLPGDAAGATQDAAPRGARHARRLAVPLLRHPAQARSACRVPGLRLPALAEGPHRPQDPGVTGRDVRAREPRPVVHVLQLLEGLPVLPRLPLGSPA